MMLIFVKMMIGEKLVGQLLTKNTRMKGWGKDERLSGQNFKS